MRIAFLAGHSSVHTVKWVNEMALRGHEVHLITMHPGTEALHPSIRVYQLPFKPPYGYYFNAKHLRKLLHKIQPDLLNTHYASGYGTLARLSGFHPNLLSIWGSDVFDFPYESKIKMKIMQRNLAYADQIASTSNIMRQQAEKICRPNKEIAITPFGVDCERFKPTKIDKIYTDNPIRIGTVKRMESKYGISTLIEAFALIKSRYKGNSELILVGGGPEEDNLKKLAQRLNVYEYTDFVGPVPHYMVPEYLNSFDIYVALSNSESFGVAIIEASACGVPVVVSDAGGLPEVVVDGETGYIVPPNNPEEAADRMLRLLNNPSLRVTMGEEGRRFVLNNYEWKENANRMECLYKKVIDDYKCARGVV